MEVFDCSSPGPGVHTGEEGTEGAGEHGAGGESGSESAEAGGEEGSGANALAPDATFDSVRSGARLILNYDAARNSFNGTVENTTEGVLYRVRIEVHLSNGEELGPDDSDGHGSRRGVRDPPTCDAGIVHWMDSTC